MSSKRLPQTRRGWVLHLFKCVFTQPSVLFTLLSSLFTISWKEEGSGWCWMRHDGCVGGDREQQDNMPKFNGNYFEGRWDSQYGPHDETMVPLCSIICAYCLIPESYDTWNFWLVNSASPPEKIPGGWAWWGEINTKSMCEIFQRTSYRIISRTLAEGGAELTPKSLLQSCLILFQWNPCSKE